MRRKYSSPSIRAMQLVLFLAAITLVSGVVGSLTARAAPDRLADFQLSGRYDLHVSNRLVPTAKIYFSKPTGAYLVEDATLPTSVLIYPRTGCAESITAEEREVRADGGLDLLIGELPCRYGKYRIEGAGIAFTAGSVAARLKPKPPVLGPKQAAALDDHTPGYARAAKLYQPNAEVLARLAKSEMSVRVFIYFGSWCGTCSRLIPRILRVEEELKKLGSNITFVYYGLPAMPAFQKHAEVRRMQITKIPAGFLYVGERGIGRITSTEWNSPESALARFVK